METKVVGEEIGLNIAELQAKTTAELHEIARQLDLSGFKGMRKNTLVMEILRKETEKEGLQFSQGILEVLPDGYGFLRVDGHTPSTEDVYVSPSQIRRFHLRTGDIVLGQVRPPKENERYFALLRVVAVNSGDPARAMRRDRLDDLPPVHTAEVI